MRNRIREMLPHAVILICNMYVVFFLIDRVNPAMNFIDNGLTKGLLALLCAGAVIDALALRRLGRRTRRRAAGRGARPTNGASRKPAGYPTHQSPALTASPRGEAVKYQANRGAVKPANRSAARPAGSRGAERPAGRAARPAAQRGGKRP